VCYLAFLSRGIAISEVEFIPTEGGNPLKTKDNLIVYLPEAAKSAILRFEDSTKGVIEQRIRLLLPGSSTRLADNSSSQFESWLRNSMKRI
jgi:hypothetical protein